MEQPHSISLRRAESFSNGAKQSPRNITAPFQTNIQYEKPPSPTHHTLHEEVLQFPPLENLHEITFEKYCGPTPESNWVIPEALLVGAYPASQDDAETFELLTSILKHGVTKFVCLQQEYRTHGVTEEMWRSGHALRPYFEDVKLIVKMKDSIPELNGFNIVHNDKLNFVHFPIKDCGITDDSRVLELARALVKSIHEKEIVYLHCWGGHGRTGTLVCIMLHLMYGLNPVESMARCQFVHDLRQCPVVVGSPQTQSQRDQVTRVITRLMSHTTSLRRTISDISLNEQALSAKSPRSAPSPQQSNRKSLSLHSSIDDDNDNKDSQEEIIHAPVTTNRSSISMLSKLGVVTSKLAQYEKKTAAPKLNLSLAKDNGLASTIGSPRNFADEGNTDKR